MIKVGLIGDPSELSPEALAIVADVFRTMERLFNDRERMARLEKQYRESVLEPTDGFKWYYDPSETKR